MLTMDCRYARVQDDRRESLGFIAPDPPAEGFNQDPF